MKKISYLFLMVALLTSCAELSESYVIKGSSSVSQLDGRKMYLKVLKNKELSNFDSCEVVHGKFQFSGSLDTTMIASLFMDDQSLMPVVVEKGDISVFIDNGKQKVSGTPLNDKLYAFLDQITRLQNQMQELDHRYNQMLLDGIDEADAGRKISGEMNQIAHQEDSLVTDFVTANFDNLLAPFVFVQLASSVPQIEQILTNAPDAFKNNPMVSDFYKSVTESMNGNENAD
jgi:hypothetical protein